MVELEQGSVVVGADETPTGIAAVRWALAEGALRGLPVTVVRAWVDPVTYGYSGMTYGSGRATLASTELDAVAQAALETAQDVLRQAGGSADGATARAVKGAPAQVLCEASRTAAMVVVGTRAAGVLSRGVLGSVSAAVLHHATGPVVVVPEPRKTAPGPGRVLVGVDHSAPASQALAWAVDEARRREAVLVPVLVHAPVGDPAAQAHLEVSERRVLLDAARREAPDLQVEPEVLGGHPARALLGLATPADLLVVGARGRGGFASLLLGSTSTAVAQHAPCPVVVVRPTR